MHSSVATSGKAVGSLDKARHHTVAYMQDYIYFYRNDTDTSVFYTINSVDTASQSTIYQLFLYIFFFLNSSGAVKSD